MNSQNDTTPQQSGITGETSLAIISVALAALWIAFAFYHGATTEVDGNRILLLHPLVPIALIAMLIRIYRWVGIKFIVHLEIIMIGLWIFVRMLGVFMPFILGFGFAYLFRFLWRALPFKKYYQRAIATVLIVVVCGVGLTYTGFRVGDQVRQMARGLHKFYHERLLPLVEGDEYTAFAVDQTGDTETLILGTKHGIYFLKNEKKSKDNQPKNEPAQIGITNGELVGKPIDQVTVGNKYIYAIAENEIYRCNKAVIPTAPGKTKRSLIAPPEELEWRKLRTTYFVNHTLQTIHAPAWDPNLIYVGTPKGLHRSNDAGDNWSEEDIAEEKGRSILSIDTIEISEEPREAIDVPRKNRFIYVVSAASTNGQENETNSDKELETPSNISTKIHSRQLNTINKWDDPPLKTKDRSGVDIHALFIATNRATKKDKLRLYAGTKNDIYEKINPIEGTLNWEQMEESDLLPQSVTLLVATTDGLYAGDKNVIHFRPEGGTSTWKPFMVPNDGLLELRNQPFVQQFQDYLTEKIPGWTASGGAAVRWLSGLAGTIAFQFGGFLATVSLAFIVFVYASQGFDKYIRSFINLVPEKHRDTTMAYLREIDTNMHQFLKGQFTVIVIVSIISCIVYRLVGVPFALLVGILAGFCNAIPTFGPFIGGGFAYIAMLMGLAAGEFSSTIGFLIRCIFVLGAVLGIQAIDNSLISPKVMSNAVDVDPLLIMFSVIVGASILGFWGVLLAIPIIVVIKSIIAVSRSEFNESEEPVVQE